MKKSNQIIISVLGAIFIFSIAFQLNVNRHLRNDEFKKEAGTNISNERTVPNFNKITVRHGIEVFFTQDSITLVKVDAPENTLPTIITKVENGMLLIEKTQQTKNGAIVKVFVSNNQLHVLKVSSGAYFETIGEVVGSNLALEFSSDTRANLALSYQSVQCKAASGSQIKFKGNTSTIEFTN